METRGRTRAEVAMVPDFPPIHRGPLDTLQVNLGYRCNQACIHCHVDAGPKRREEMTTEVVDLVLDFLAARDLRVLDITGGAPELNPSFRYLVSNAVANGVSVIDRCNLTVLSEPGQETLASFLGGHGVTVIASMPCYQRSTVEAQRGKGVFDRSIRGLLALNRLGYGIDGSGLELNLVHNPAGAALPPAQADLETAYKDALMRNYGIRFNRLLTLCNMPVNRFRDALDRQGALAGYIDLLVGSFAPANLEHVMCRSLISVDWRGDVYDCDFNQMLGLPIGARGRRTHLSELLNEPLTGEAVTVAEHCYGCTAGRGSSCGGAFSD